MFVNLLPFKELLTEAYSKVDLPILVVGIGAAFVFYNAISITTTDQAKATCTAYQDCKGCLSSLYEKGWMGTNWGYQTKNRMTPDQEQVFIQKLQSQETITAPAEVCNEVIARAHGYVPQTGEPVITGKIDVVHCVEHDTWFHLPENTPLWDRAVECTSSWQYWSEGKAVQYLSQINLNLFKDSEAQLPLQGHDLSTHLTSGWWPWAIENPTHVRELSDYIAFIYKDDTIWHPSGSGLYHYLTKATYDVWQFVASDGTSYELSSWILQMMQTIPLGIV